MSFAHIRVSHRCASHPWRQLPHSVVLSSAADSARRSSPGAVDTRFVTGDASGGTPVKLDTLPGQKATKGTRVVLLGCGWAGFQLALNLKKHVPLTVISPRNHFVFTPLLPSSAVGTLECRAIQEPVRTILGPNGSYLQAKATLLDPVQRTIFCQSTHGDEFEVEYDKLVIAVGVKTNTFGIPSIQHGDGIYFLKTLAHARAIRSNIIDSFEKAAIPTVSVEERKRLLAFVIVGGGPTSCEFTAELHDFVKNDVKRLYPDLLEHVTITLVEAGPALLGPFDSALQEYALGLFKNRAIDVRLGTAVTGVEDYLPESFHFPGRRALLSDNTSIPFGTMVWSAGLAPRTFTESLDGLIERNPRNKRILVDEYCRVKGHEGTIWAVGDAAVNSSGNPLPQLAQVARQQGLYLADVFNGKRKEDEKPFEFFSLGSMAFMGDHTGIYDGSSIGAPKAAGGNGETKPKDFVSSVVEYIREKHPKMTGIAALLLWRFAYWGRQTSVANKIMIPVHWLKSYVFGRDVSRY